jgi:hypothetical protein
VIDKRTIWVDWCTARVVQALHDAGVHPLLLKGPAIATWLYPENPRTRSYADVDLLVAPPERVTAEAVLTALGYAPPQTRAWLRDEPPHALTWARHADGSEVDLHRTIHGCEHVDDALVWDVVSEKASTICVGGVDVPVPGEGVRALHVALHAIPGWGDHVFVDLERAVANVDLDVWEQAVAAARRLGVADELGFRLGLVAGGAALAGELGLSTSTPARQSALAFAMTLPGWRARSRYLVQKLFPPPAYLRSVGALGPGRLALARAYAGRVVLAVRGGRRSRGNERR